MMRVSPFVSSLALLLIAVFAVGDEPRVKDAVPALKELLKHRDGRTRWKAAEALWRLEHKAADVVPVYAELLTAKDADVRAASAWRLGRMRSIDRPAVLHLAAALRDENYEVRIQVGQALANLGAHAEPALPALMRALADPQLDEPGRDKHDRDGARTSPALLALVEQPDAAIPLLIESFRESPPIKRHDLANLPESNETSYRLASVMPAFGARAVPSLLKALDSKSDQTRKFAAHALKETAQLHGLPENVIDRLEKCLDDSDLSVRGAAIDAMSFVRPSSAKAVAVLVEARKAIQVDGSELLVRLERMSPHNDAARKLLLVMLGDKDDKTAQEAYRILAGLALPSEQALELWTKALSHDNRDVRSEATAAIRKLGTRAKPAKSALYEQFNKKDNKNKEEALSSRDEILDALHAIDPDDPALIPFLIRSMGDHESSVRRHAVRCLAHLGPKAITAIPTIEASLSIPGTKHKDGKWDEMDARDLVEAVGRIVPGSAKSGVILLKALRNREIRGLHCLKHTWHLHDILEDELLASLPAAAPSLREAMKDRDADVRRSAALVLVRAGLDIDTAVPVLMENLWTSEERDSEHTRFQHRVVDVLMRRRANATPAVAAAWCKAWQKADPKGRGILEPGLLALQPETLPLLLDQLRQAKTPQSQRDLAHLLARFAGQGKQVVSILREELREPKDTSRFAAATALTAIGADAADAVPELMAMLGYKSPGMRAVAVRALGAVGRTARPAVPALKAILKDDNAKLRLVAADALSRIDPGVSEALAVMRNELVGENHSSGTRLVDSLELPESLKGENVFPESAEEGITRFGERAAKVLAEVVDNEDLDEWSSDNPSSQCGASVRVRAALILAHMGSEAKSAVPSLMRALKDRDPFIREAAASALGRIGPAAKSAAPEFISLHEQQNRAASAGTWSSSTRMMGRSRDGDRVDYGGPFDFRSAGRRHVLRRGGLHFGYAYSNQDPYATIRPRYPYDPAYVLSRIDAEARSALPILREMAKDPNHPGRLSAALAMRRSGDESPDLIPAFMVALESHAKLATNESVPLTREMRECLAELDTQLKPAVRGMVQWLTQHSSSSDQDDEIAVVEALGRLGADAKAAMDVLRPMLEYDNWRQNRRVAAALALYRIRGEKGVAFPVLRDVLSGLEERRSLYYIPDMSNTGRVHAARALGVLVEKGDERARALLAETAKGDENDFVRLAALEATARQKQTNAAGMKGLCALLRHPNAGVRSEAASACGRLGTLAKSSMTALKVAAEDENLAVRQAAKNALEHMN